MSTKTLTYEFNFKLRDQKTGCTIQTELAYNSKRIRKSTGIIIKENQWNYKEQIVNNKHLEAASLNRKLAAIKKKMIDPIEQAIIEGKNDVDFRAPLKGENLFVFVQTWLKELEGKRAKNTILAHSNSLRKIKVFLDRRLEGKTKDEIDAVTPDFTFEELTQYFLRDFEIWLKNGGVKSRGKERSGYLYIIWQHMKVWCNLAKERGVSESYPFTKYINPKIVNEDKASLRYEELKKLEKYTLAQSGIKKEVGLYFLLGCYSGLRVSDWYSFSAEKNVDGMTLKIRPAKTKDTTGAWVAMTMSTPLARIVDLTKEVKLSVNAQYINKVLKKIAKDLNLGVNLSTHCGRKTFAVTVCAANNIKLEHCALLMGIHPRTCLNSYYVQPKPELNKVTAEAWKHMK